MSSTLAPFGFQPVNTPVGLTRTRSLYSGIASGYNTAIFKGQPIALNSSGNIIAPGSAQDIIGVFAGVEYTPAGGGRRVLQPNWVANTTYDPGTLIAYYWEDPEIVYRAQADGSLSQSAVGSQMDANFPGTAGSVYTGLSLTSLATGTLTNSGQAMFRVVDLFQSPDNAWGDSYTVVLCKIARHQYVSNKVAV